MLWGDRNPGTLVIGKPTAGFACDQNDESAWNRGAEDVACVGSPVDAVHQETPCMAARNTRCMVTPKPETTLEEIDEPRLR